MLYLSRDTSPSAVFFVHMSTGNALGGTIGLINFENFADTY